MTRELMLKRTLLVAVMALCVVATSGPAAAKDKDKHHDKKGAAVHSDHGKHKAKGHLKRATDEHDPVRKRVRKGWEHSKHKGTGHGMSTTTIRTKEHSDHGKHKGKK
jgi:hypothetical protein